MTAPPAYSPGLDAIRWLEDYAHGPSRPRTWRCTLIFWRKCEHRRLARTRGKA